MPPFRLRLIEKHVQPRSEAREAPKPIRRVLRSAVQRLSSVVARPRLNASAGQSACKLPRVLDPPSQPLPLPNESTPLHMLHRMIDPPLPERRSRLLEE